MKSKLLLLLVASVVFVFSWSDQIKANEITSSASNVYVDGTKVIYSVAPIVMNGTTLVPLRETFETMGATVEWNQAEQKITSKNGNTEVVMIINSKVAYVDGQSVPLTTPAIIYQNKTMIPLRFVGEAFAGTVTYNTTTKDIHITMPKFMTDFLEVKTATLNNIKNVENTKTDGNRRLMVSDNPEVLDANSITSLNTTLWNDIVVEKATKKNHRVFAWHINKMQKNVVLGITIENRSKTNKLTIKNAKGIHKKSQNTWYEHDIGLPLAESLLSNRLQTIPLTKNTVLPGETVQLGYYLMNTNDALGLINDFTIAKSGVGSMNYVIRTVVSEVDYDIKTIKNEPVPADKQNPHPRGVWASSDLTVTLPEYQVGQEVTYNISNGKTDDLLSANNSLVDPLNSISNKGHFGVVYKVMIPYVNSTDETKNIQVRIGSRGGDYSGSVKIKKDVYNVPTIQAMKDVAIVVNEQITGENNSGVISLDIVHAGGASLPIAINVITVD